MHFVYQNAGPAEGPRAQSTSESPSETRGWEALAQYEGNLSYDPKLTMHDNVKNLLEVAKVPPEAWVPMLDKMYRSVTRIGGYMRGQKGAKGDPSGGLIQAQCVAIEMQTGGTLNFRDGQWGILGGLNILEVRRNQFVQIESAAGEKAEVTAQAAGAGRSLREEVDGAPTLRQYGNFTARENGSFEIGRADKNTPVPETGADFYKMTGATRITFSFKRFDAAAYTRLRQATWDENRNCYRFTDNGKKLYLKHRASNVITPLAYGSPNPLGRDEELPRRVSVPGSYIRVERTEDVAPPREPHRDDYKFGPDGIAKQIAMRPGTAPRPEPAPGTDDYMYDANGNLKSVIVHPGPSPDPIMGSGERPFFGSPTPLPPHGAPKSTPPSEQAK